ncbi:MAG TPA: hypothetical protein VGJ26_06930, partial [Pirellulales bacterium]
MKHWKFTVAAILLAPSAGCVTKAQLQQANQALELENFHLEQRLNDLCWKLEDAERSLAASRPAGAIPIYSGGTLTPVKPGNSSTPANRDPRSPAGDVDIDKPPKIELPDDEPNMPSAGRRKERAPRYDGPPIISPPDPNVPEGILPQPVSSRSPEGGPEAAPDAGGFRAPMENIGPGCGPPGVTQEAPPRAEPEPIQESRPIQSPNWRPPNVSTAPPMDQAPLAQPEPESVRPQEAPLPMREPESVSAPGPYSAPDVARGPEPVPVPAPVGEPAPVGQAVPPPLPESVAAPPGDFDRNLQAQPDSRALVEPEPIAAPYPSTAARPTSAPVGRAPGVGNSPIASSPAATNPAGNAALSMMAVNPKLTAWRQSLQGNSPDDGLTIVVEPRSASGEMVEVAGDISIIALDASREGAAAKVGRWDFSADKVAQHFKGTQAGGGLHFRLEWPGERPKANRLELFVRLTLPDRRQFVAEYELKPTGEPAMPESPPSAAPESTYEPTEPPPGPEPSSPANSNVTPTAAWSNVNDLGAARKTSQLGFVSRASGNT